VIAHIVLFKPRADMPAGERDRVLQALTTAAVDIPAIRSLRVGRRVVHGLPGYEQLMAQDFEYALILEFDDIEGLKTYLTHQDHAALGEHFTTSAAAALAYDYEMLELKAT
jgi:hypothetical protein